MWKENANFKQAMLHSQSVPGCQLLEQIPHGVFYRSVPALFHCCGGLACSLVHAYSNVFPFKPHQLPLEGPVHYFPIATVDLLWKKNHPCEHKARLKIKETFSRVFCCNRVLASSIGLALKYITWLRGWHTRISAPRWHESPGALCHPMPKASGDVTRQGFRVAEGLIFWYSRPRRHVIYVMWHF